MTLSSAYLAELTKGENQPTTILEVVLDSGTVKWGTHGDMSDVSPIIKSIYSLHIKIHTRKGYTTRVLLTVVISGRYVIKALVKDEYLTNRRVTRKDGFVGIVYADYADTFTGTISDWSRKGDELTLTIKDDMKDASKTKIPVEVSTGTALNTIDYRNTNPVDIMTNILLTQLSIAAGNVDSTQFTSERDLWLNGWKFDRVLTSPTTADQLLNELQTETNSFVVNDGEKISYKVFAPPVPGTTTETWTDDNNVLSGSLAEESGFHDNFYNRVVFFYDYDESGSDKPENFETWLIISDAASQGSSEWDETKTKEIKSKWNRTHTFSGASNITGTTVYHVSLNNGIGSGTLTFTYDAGGKHTMQWTSPGGTIGAAVSITQDGKYQIFDIDKTKYCRVVVDHSALPTSNQTDTITTTALAGSIQATSVANKILSIHRNPRATVTFEVGLNDVSTNGSFIKPTDFKDLTTDEAFEKGENTWTTERVMFTSVRPDFARHRVKIEAIEAKMYRKYGFIATAGLNDYPTATAAEKEYAYIGETSNLLDGGTSDGDYVW